MPRPATIHSGDRFGRLIAVDRVRNEKGELYWRFACDCGNEVIASGRVVNRKVNPYQSCGCLRREMMQGATHPMYTHGKRGSRVYRIWNAMRQRCHNPNQPHYSRYGGLGVVVCDAWRKSFVAFYEDMGDPPSETHSIDRIDPAGNYEPRNCRWASPVEQRHNRRKDSP